MRRAVASFLGAAWLAAGCSEDVSTAQGEIPPDAPEYAQTCGVSRPVSLLELQPDEYAYALEWGPEHERVLVSVFRTSGPLGLFPSTDNRAVVAVDPCGENPTLIAEGVELVKPHQNLVLACAVDGSALFRLDPSGASDPVRVLDGTCAVRRTDEGLVAVLAGPGDVGRLVIVRDPAGPMPAIETLVDGVGVPSNPFFGGNDHRTTPLWAKGSEALAMTPAGDVLSVDLITGDSATLVTGALQFRASSGGGLLVWQSQDELSGDPEAPSSPIFLFTRETGTQQFMLNSHLAWTVAPFRHNWVVLRDDSSLGQRIFGFDGEELALPSGTFLRGILNDTEFWLGRKREDDSTEELFWDMLSEPRFVIDHRLGHASKQGDGIKVFEDADHPGDLEGSLRLGAFNGGQVEELSARVNFHHRVLPDGRILGILNEDANAHGSLRLEDPADGSVVELDPHGYLHSPTLNLGDPFDGDVVYAVDDPADASRHAVYRARLR